jgi:hypothetical protein
MNTLFNYLNYQLRSKKNNDHFYHRMRADYVQSHGSLINLISKINQILCPKYNMKFSEGILGKLSNADTSVICNEIKKNGYYIFPNLLSSELVSSMRKFSENVDLHYLIPDKNNISYSPQPVSYINSKGISNRYQIRDIEKFNTSPEILRFIQDENLLSIANLYLGSLPYLDLVILWWSTSFENLNIDDKTKAILKDKSAQMFHFDMDRLKFLKFFLYLTDVDTHNGPHVYVRSSHNNLPKYINRDGRYEDQMIIDNDSNNVVEITGKAGTLIAVDTRGLHKGKELDQGERLIFQIEFTNSFFGKPEYPTLKNKFKFNGNPKYFETYKYFFTK